MKAKTVEFLLLTMAIALLALSSLDTCYAASGTLEGNITDMGVMAPLADATVTVKQGTTTVAETTTDAAGFYQFMLPADDYTVIASKTGYISGTGYATVADGSTTILSFDLERTEPVVNGGFETGSLEPWVNSGGASATVTATLSHTGVYSLETGGFTYQIVTQDFYVEAKTISRLIFWVYVPENLEPDMDPMTTGAKSFSVTIEYLEAPGSETVPIDLSYYTPGWNRIVLPFSEGVRVTGIGFATGEIAVLYIDDVFLPRLTYDFESCDASGVTKDTFNTGEEIYVKGSGWPAMPPSAYRGFNLFVVEDATWTDGMPIPPVALQYSWSAGLADFRQFAPDYEGNFIALINPGSRMTAPDAYEKVYLAPGYYDIIVDVNNNGVYDEGIDVIDDMDVSTGGIFVVPEVPMGVLSAFAAMILALGLVKRKGIKLHA